MRRCFSKNARILPHLSHLNAAFRHHFEAAPHDDRRGRAAFGCAADDRAGADAHLLGHDVLPLRVPGDLDRAVRPERERRLRLPRPPTVSPASRRARCSRARALVFAVVAPGRARLPGTAARRADLLARQPAPDAGHLPAGRAALLRGRRGRSRWRIVALRPPRQRRVRGRPDRRGGRLPGPASRSLNSVGAPGRRARRRRRWRALAAVLFAPAERRRTIAGLACSPSAVAGAAHAAPALFDVRDTKGHEDDRVLFSKWNSFSRIGVYDRPHGDWSLSPRYTGALPRDALHGHRLGGLDADPAAAQRRLGRRLPPLRADRARLPAQGRRIGDQRRPRRRRRASGAGHRPRRRAAISLSALVLRRRPRRRRRDQPDHRRRRDVAALPRLLGRASTRTRRCTSSVDDGRSFVRRSTDALRRDPGVAGRHLGGDGGRRLHADREHASTRSEAFDDYLDHLTDDGMLTITRWVFDGLRLVSLAQEACARRGVDAASRLAIVQHRAGGDVPAHEARRSRPAGGRAPAGREPRDSTSRCSTRLPTALTTPGRAAAGTGPGDYARLLLAPDRQAFYGEYPLDVHADDRRPSVLLPHARSSSQRHVGAVMRAFGAAAMRLRQRR